MEVARTVLYIDSAYSLAEVREKQHESFFLARHASGFFKGVISVHPMADVVGAEDRRIDVFSLTPDHTVIEGKAELLRLPRILLPLNFLLSQARLYQMLVRLVRREKVSMVMVADPFYSALLGLAVARRCGIPFGIRLGGNSDEIYEATGALAMPRLFPSYRIQKAVQRFVLKRADLVAGINRNNLGFGLNNGARKLTAIIPISSNVAATHRRPLTARQDGRPLLQRLGVPTEGPVLLYVGRLIELKHPDDAVRAMAAVIRRHPGTAGVLAGLGPMQAQLEGLARELGVASSIFFVGQLDQEALSRIIPHCIMLSPSAGQLALLECALGGAPIVAYDRDFQPEFIDDGVDGFIVPYRDHAAMAERAAKILADRNLARGLSEAVRIKAEFHVDPNRVREAEWDAFGKALGTRMPD
jgi:glycosyltransferase involved in cell wall biosynthesis